MAITQTQTDIIKLTVVMFKAVPGGYMTALEDLSTSVNNDMTALANALAGLSAFTALYTGTNAEKAVSMAASYGLDSTTDAGTAAIAYFTQNLDAGASIGSLFAAANAFLAVSTDAAYTAAQDTLANKTTVAEYYTVTAALTSTDLATLTAQVASVTNDDATVTTAQAAIDAIVSPVQALTTSVDTLVGTANNDTFTATSATIAAGDVVLDQSTTDNDTMNMTLTANNAALRVSGIENVNVNWNAFGTAGIIATNITGATITGTSTKTGFLGHMTITDAGANTIVAGSGMVGTMTVNGGTSVTVNGDAARTIVVNGTGTAADDLSATVTAGSNVTSVTVGTTNAFKTTTVDAGTATTVSIKDQGAAANVTTLTVGASAGITLNNTGATTLNVNAADVTSSLTLTAIGEGLTVAGAQATTINATSAGFNAETVTNGLTAGTLTAEINGSIAADADLSNIDADLFVIDTANTGDVAVAVASGSAINADINLGSGELGVLTADDTATDTLTITSSVATQTIIQVDGLDATLGDIETLNIIAAATAVTGTDLTITDIEAGTGTVNITGTNDVVVTEAIAGTVNATGLTGNFTMTQQAADTAAMVVSGSTATNSITFTAAANDSSYTGQNGADTVVFVNDAGNATAVLGDGANNVTASSLTTGSLVVLGGSGVDTITASSAGDGTGEVNLSLGAGNDVMNITTGAAATTNILTVDAGAGNDNLTLDAATVADDIMTLAFGEGTDTLTISSADLSAGTWTVSGLEKIAIGSSDTAAEVDASFITGKSYEITGDGTATDHLKVTTATAGSYDFSSINVNQTITLGLAGLSIVGSATNDTIVATTTSDIIDGGAGTNTITGGQGKDTMTSNGTDTFVFASGDTGLTTATVDALVTFTTTADKVSLGDVAGSATNYYELDTDSGATDQIATVELAITAAEAAAGAGASFDGTVKYMFVFDSDSGVDGYLVVDSDLDGTANYAIEITGKPTDAGFAFGDIIA